MYKDKFVLSILNNGNVLREFGPYHNRQVGLPFDSEYIIRLRNKNDIDCTARIFVDGAPLSNLGDILIQAGSSVNIERFITDSMDSGKKLKFVSLNNGEVNDPYSSENGVIRVEFRLAKTNNFVITTGYIPYTPYTPYTPIYIDPYVSPLFRGPTQPYPYLSVLEKTYCCDGSVVSFSDSITNSITDDQKNGYLSKGTYSGATIEGDTSNQKFSNMYVDVESYPSTTLKLKIVGLKDTPINNIVNNFCTKCGKPWRKGDKFCGNCGHKF